MFVFFIQLHVYDKEGKMPYFEWSWKFNDRSRNYHRKIMEFYFLFSVETLIYVYWMLHHIFPIFQHIWLYFAHISQ